jgi:hypothetical protein
LALGGQTEAHSTPARCEVDAALVIDGHEQNVHLRWVREAADGLAAAPSEPGEWRLISWNPRLLLSRDEPIQGDGMDA